MTPFGKILKFGFYDAQQIERLKNDFSLSVSSLFLQYCANYYKKQARRDPYIEELKLLERLSVSLQNAPELIAVQELYTNDLAVAETYRDMMQKRRELMGDRSVPITAGELSTLANNTLLRVGKKPSQPFPLTVLEKGRLLQIPAAYDRIPKSDDAFLLLSVPNQEEADLDGLFARNAFSSSIKSIQRIKNGGVILALLRECDAFRIDLDTLCDEGDSLFASILTEAFIGSYLIRIPRDAQEKVIATAQEHGICAKVIAHADKGGCMTALCQQKELFSLDTAFLKTLFSQRKISAKLQNEKDGSLLPHGMESNLLPLEDFCCNQTSCASQNAFFTNAFYTALLAIVRQCLCGSDYADQQISVELRIPERLDEKTSGAYLSTLIGLYRLQAELGILSAAPSTVTDGQIDSPTLSVFSLGKGKPLPCRLQATGSYVYLLRIATTENRLPDFDELRKQLWEISQWRRNGSLRSACAVCGDSPEDALRFLSQGDLICSFDENTFRELPQSPVSVIVESAFPLETAHYMGTVTKKEEVL